MERVVRRELKKMEMRFQIGMAIAGMWFFITIIFLYIHWNVGAFFTFALTLTQFVNALTFLDIKNEIKNKFTFWR